MKKQRTQVYLIGLASLMVLALITMSCSNGDGGDGDYGDGTTELMGTYQGTFVDDEPTGLGTDNSASMVLNFQNASGFSGTATVYGENYIVGGSIDEQTGEIGILLTPTGGGITIAVAASLFGNVLSGNWSNTIVPPPNHGSFSLTRQ